MFWVYSSTYEPVHENILSMKRIKVHVVDFKAKYMCDSPGQVRCNRPVTFTIYNRYLATMPFFEGKCLIWVICQAICIHDTCILLG